MKLHAIITVNIQTIKQRPELMILEWDIKLLHAGNKLAFCDERSVAVFSQDPKQIDETKASGTHKSQEHFHCIWSFCFTPRQYMRSSDAFIPGTAEVGTFLEKSV